MARPRQSATNSDGFVVIAVLWMLGGLATLVSIYALYVINTRAGFSAHEDGFRADAVTSSALELTALRLSAPGEFRQPRGRFSFRLNEATAEVSFRSEAARIDLNAASKELLTGLFSSLGARRDTAENAAARIVAWRTIPSKDQDEAAAYRMARLSYVPRGAKFPQVNELSLVLGLPISLVERALPLVTVYSGRAQVNVLDAAPEVLAALPGMSPERLNAVLAQRNAAKDNGQLALALLGQAQAYASIDLSKASRVTVRIAFNNGRQLSSEVVILVFETGNEPYAVLSWQNDLDATPKHQEARL